jgi:hypothetical protein
MKAPEQIILTDNECFIDADGNISNIVTIGERHRDKCFFLFDDVVAFFKFSLKKNNNVIIVDRNDIANMITTVNSAYKYKDHHIYFIYDKKKTLFITFQCLVKLLFHFSNKHTEKISSWCNDILFTAKFVSDSEKINLLFTKLGVEAESAQKTLGLASCMIPSIYSLSEKSKIYAKHSPFLNHIRMIGSFTNMDILLISLVELLIIKMTSKN